MHEILTICNISKLMAKDHYGDHGHSFIFVFIFDQVILRSKQIVSCPDSVIHVNPGQMLRPVNKLEQS